MNITIYQINIDRDKKAVAFESYEALVKHQSNTRIDSTIYDVVFDGDVECDNLEDVFRTFNVDHPEGYKGRSLSVSDVVEIYDEEKGESKWFYCDCIGWKEISFDPYKAGTLQDNFIKVVYCEPGKKAEVKEIRTELKYLQAAVHGDIEAYYPFENEACCIVCNEEGKFNGMLPNRAVMDEDGDIMDIIFGPFFICDCSGENFGSLSEEQLERYADLFRKPERFIRADGKIVVIPFGPDSE